MSTNGITGGAHSAVVGVLGQPGPPRHPHGATQAPPLYQPPQLAAMRRPCSTYDPYRPNGSGPSSSSSSPSMLNVTLSTPEAAAGVCRLPVVASSGASNSGSSLGGGPGAGTGAAGGGGGGKKRRLEGDGSVGHLISTFVGLKASSVP